MAFGERWDKRADMFFNSLSYCGIGAIVAQGGMSWRAGVLASLFVAFAASLVWIRAGQVGAKLRSGAIRVALVALFLSEIATDELAVPASIAAILLVGGGLYELGVIRRTH